MRYRWFGATQVAAHRSIRLIAHLAVTACLTLSSSHAGAQNRGGPPNYGSDVPGDPSPEQPPAEAPHPDYVLRGEERLAWDVSTADPSRVRFALYVNGERQPMEDVSCTRRDTAGEHECQASMPDLAPGDHWLWVSMIDATDDALESAGSFSILVRVEPPSSEPPDLNRRGSAPAEVRAETVVAGLQDVTDLAVLPDGRVLIAERAGAVKIYPKAPTLVTALRLEAVRTGDGHGLLALALDPDVSASGVYVLYSTTRGLRVERYTLRGDTLGQGRVVIDELPIAASRPSATLRTAPDGSVYVAVDDRSSARRAADLGDYSGKLLHVLKDGTAATGSATRSPVQLSGLRRPSAIVWTADSPAPWLADVTAAGEPVLRRAPAAPTDARTATVEIVLGQPRSFARGAVTGVLALPDGALMFATAESPAGVWVIPMRDGVASRAAWWPAAGLSTTLRALAAGAEGTTYASTADTLMQLRIGVAAP